MSYFYVITPISTDPDFMIKRAVLEDVGGCHGCKPFFPLEHRTEFSLRVARADLLGARLVFADLSHERPSCYFEVGLAQALDLPVVLIAQEGTRIHQVADRDRIWWYDSMPRYEVLVIHALAEIKSR